MIKLIVFDLDGVLIEAKQFHYEALNDALNLHVPNCNISWNEHLSKYDGLKTKQKLEMLSQEKGLDRDLHNIVWDEKQRITNEKLKSITQSIDTYDLLLSTSGSDPVLKHIGNVIANAIDKKVKVIAQTYHAYESIYMADYEEKYNMVPILCDNCDPKYK
jgi:beta-phosphoglucomutase-like phosphatase (HAD superfamily)